MNKKQYLGDSVYVLFDGYGLWLTTENGLPTDPSNEIFLEPEVYASLLIFVKRIEEEAKEVNSNS
jgi:hypothetical protein